MPEVFRSAQKRFRQNNPGAKNASTAERRTSKWLACPHWRNTFMITETYRLAALRTKVTGITWVVDHIVPIKHPLVCGLHAEDNLQVVTETYNATKSNHFVVG